MMFVDNPLRDIHDAMSHAQYEGFSNIHYEQRDYSAIRNAKTTEDRANALHATIPATRRPTERDFFIHSMFPQTWGSTSLGHGGMGGASVTTAYTIVLECPATQEFLVYFGGQFCYKLKRTCKYFDEFMKDCQHRCLEGKRKAKEKYGWIE
jgi:hypothetical protein